jgi:hypothetical protein
MSKMIKFSLLPIVLLALLLSGCAQVPPPPSAPQATSQPTVPIKKTISSWYQEDFNRVEQPRKRLATHYVSRGYATWYSVDEHGSKTSSGQIYDLYGMTAAHPSLPLFSRVKVKNLRTGRSIVVTINDDFYDNDKKVLIKLSYWAARRLNLIKHPSQRIEITVL